VASPFDASWNRSKFSNIFIRPTYNANIPYGSAKLHHITAFIAVKSLFLRRIWQKYTEKLKKIEDICPEPVVEMGKE